MFSRTSNTRKVESMRKKLLSMTLTAVAALALQFAPVAQAALLWDNGPPATVFEGGSQMSAFNQAADFQLSFTSNLTSITFWSLEGGTGDYAGSIAYRIVGNAGGAPDDATVYGSGSATPTRTAAGTAAGLSVVKNDFAVAVAGLVAGTYWLELHNGALSTTSDTVEFYWSFADANAANGTTFIDQEFSLLPPGVAWTSNDAEHAFLVNGDRVVVPPGTPEPGTILLAAMGIALLASRRRRQA